MRSRMPGAEHPLIAADRPHTPPNLFGQGLECEPAICRGQRAGKTVAQSLRRLGAEKDADGLLISSRQKLLVAAKRNQRLAVRGRPLPFRQMETVDRIKKEERPHALVEIFA